MNIKQIKYFAAVVEHGSLSAAAKDQYVTVQAVSKAIADLERELGSPLFVRESRGVRPTPFGRAFHQKSSAVLDRFEELERFAREYARHEGHGNLLRIALCTPAFYNHEWARKSIGAFTERLVGMEVQVPLMSGEECMEALALGMLDAFITVGSFSSPEVDCMPIGTISPAVIMAKDHPLTAQKHVSIEDMKPYPVSVSESFDHFNDSILAMYRKRDLGLKLASIPSFEELDRHLKEDKGLVFVAAIPALGELHPGSVVRPLAPDDAIAIPICLVCLKGEKSPALQTLERMLMSQLLLIGHADGN